MTIRITGMNSGLDTESIITELTKVQSDKVDSIKSKQKKLELKQDKWKELNTKIVSFYKGSLSSMRLEGTFNKKTTTSTDSDAVTVVTGSSAMNSTQSLDINSLAKSGYLTGGTVTSQSDSDITSSTTLSDLGITTSGKITLKFGTGDTTESVEVSVNASDSISDFLSNLQSAESASGYSVNASFDYTNNRFYIASSETGADESFSIDEDNSTLGSAGLAALGLLTASSYTDDDGNTVEVSNTATHQDGADAEISLNGVTYTNNTNVFEINGLTITANQEATGITLTTKNDTSGVYDMIKSFITEYNELIKEMDTLYNADDCDDYDVLTAEQEDEMTDQEIEDWNNKIDEGLLSGDSILGKVKNAMKNIMLSTFSLTNKDGVTKNIALSTFGIATGSYFNTDENERGIYHIDGDEEDDDVSSEEDKLSALIASDPDLVTEFFSSLTSSLYSKVGDLMKSTDFSSSFTVYEDKAMKKQYDKYTTELEDAQEALTDLEDKYYDQFSAMETALSKLNSQQSSLSGLLGS
ncbi:MAG: flagellar filament capping protein FliD [Butyrivibrio sp.]|nr:flagellar filament capping protein FliD [Butyrivibrio sp.]